MHFKGPYGVRWRNNRDLEVIMQRGRLRRFDRQRDSAKVFEQDHVVQGHAAVRCGRCGLIQEGQDRRRIVGGEKELFLPPHHVEGVVPFGNHVVNIVHVRGGAIVDRYVQPLVPGVRGQVAIGARVVGRVTRHLESNQVAPSHHGCEVLRHRAIVEAGKIKALVSFGVFPKAANQIYAAGSDCPVGESSRPCQGIERRNAFDICIFETTVRDTIGSFHKKA